MKFRLRLLTLAFIVSSLFVAVLSYISIARFTALADHDQWIDHSYQVTHELNVLDGAVKNIDRAERGYLLTKDTFYSLRRLRNDDSVAMAFRRLKELLRGNSEQEGKVVLLETELNLRLEDSRKSLAFADTSQGSPISPYFYAGKKKMTECSGAIRDMRLREDSVLHVRTEARTAYQQITTSSVKSLYTIFGALNLALFAALLFELRRRLKYQNELQEKLVELQRSQSELEQIAFAASHDLQEPLRKILIFSDRLHRLPAGATPDMQDDTIGRIRSSAHRMHELIGDLMSLTSLVKDSESLQQTSLKAAVSAVLDALSKKVTAAGATIEVGGLPEIKGLPGQLQILFTALVDNAIKFSRPGVPAVIRISSSIVPAAELHGIHKKSSDERFCCVTVADNGIGFDNKFANNIFGIFRQLHAQGGKYEGKGIGLAICQRVMVNHKGYILAYGHPQSGATFKLYFPV